MACLVDTVGGHRALASVVHAIAAVVMIGLIIMHVYAAIWTRGTIRAMMYGTVTRAAGQTAPPGAGCRIPATMIKLKNSR